MGDHLFLPSKRSALFHSSQRAGKKMMGKNILIEAMPREVTQRR
jgi:hypothetical protein